MDLTMKTETFGVDDMSWLGSRHGIGNCVPVTLDTSAFTQGTHYPDGFFKSGLALGKITASGLYGPYAGQSNEVQTLTEGGSGLTSFTITHSGNTTTSLDEDATAAEVQAALIALAHIDPGDVVVTGGPLGTGPFSVTFGGKFIGTDVAAMTTTPTGGTGTVVVATATAGGASPSANGLDTLAGFLFGQVAAPASNTTDVVGAMLDHGKVVNNRLPVPVDAAGRADVAGRIIFL